MLPATLPAFLWHFIKKQPLSFAAFFIAPTCIVLEANVVPYALKLVIDEIVRSPDGRAQVLDRIAPALWLGGTAIAAVCVICRSQEWLQSRFFPRFEAQIRMDVLDHVMQQPHAFFADQLAGKLASKVADLPRALKSIVMTAAWPGVATLAVFGVSLVLMARVQAAFALVTGIWIVVHLTVTTRLSHRLQRTASQNAEDKSTLGGVVVDSIANMTSARLFARRQHELAWIGKLQEAEAHSAKRLILKTNRLGMFMDLTFLMMIGVMTWLLLGGWMRDELSTGEFVYVFNMAWAVVGQMWFMGEALNTDLAPEIRIPC